MTALCTKVHRAVKKANCCVKCQVTTSASCTVDLFRWAYITNTVLTGPLTNIDNFLIVADQYLRNIYQVDPSSGTTAQLLSFGTATNPLAVAYDSTNKLIYWTDVSARTINRYSLLTNTSTVIYHDPLDIGKDICLTIVVIIMY